MQLTELEERVLCYFDIPKDDRLVSRIQQFLTGVKPSHTKLTQFLAAHMDELDGYMLDFIDRKDFLFYPFRQCLSLSDVAYTIVQNILLDIRTKARRSGWTTWEVPR